LLAVFTLGTILMRSAGCCINDVADREFDRHVKRTAQRPVTRGAVSVREALAVGAGLALLAFALVLTTNRIAVAWSFAALVVALAYPYAKRFVSMPQAVLGVAFSFGIPMGYAAVRAEIPGIAWVLLLGNLFWVLAYDTEYAMVDREDDLRIGIKTSAITLGRFDVAAIMLCYGLYLTIWTLALWPQSFNAFFGAALAVAVVYPYAKRVVAMPQAVLGVAFSFGIPMAFAAVTGAVPPVGWLLLLGNLFWVLAYDTEYAMVDREDDLRIGIKTSAITLGRWDVAAIMGFYAAYLAVWGAVLSASALNNFWMVGLAAAAAQALWHFGLIRDRSRDGCFKAFRLNHWIGFAVFAGIALSV
jgi:4-hydroxybenzoate polyprenyltransferase